MFGQYVDALVGELAGRSVCFNQGVVINQAIWNVIRNQPIWVSSSFERSLPRLVTSAVDETGLVLYRLPYVWVHLRSGGGVPFQNVTIRGKKIPRFSWIGGRTQGYEIEMSKRFLKDSCLSYTEGFVDGFSR